MTRSPRVAVRPGARPRVAHVPPADSNDAQDAIDLAVGYGLVPDDWQCFVLESWLGCRADGKYSSPRCGLAVPRQNGKNGALEIRELFGMVLLAERILHTAHEVKTARKAFARLLEFFDNPRQYPELASLVREIRKTNGQEAIVLHNGGSVEFIARSKGSGRGFSVDVLVLDEAQELSEDALAALQPTISASANPQTIFTGTPPGPKAIGEVFTRVRAAGVKGEDARLCWLEWSLDPEGLDIADRDGWFLTNPAAGIRLDIETIEDEFATQDAETFARERCGVWFDLGVGGLIPLVPWGECRDVKSQIVGAVALAVDVTPERTSGVLAAGGLRKDKLIHGEVIDVLDVSALYARTVEVYHRQKAVAVVVDPASPAGSLIPSFEAAGLNVVLISGREYAQACGALYDLVISGALRHIDQASLNAAVGGATKRTIGDAWGWNRKHPSISIAPLVAVTLAAWFAREPVDPMSNIW